MKCPDCNVELEPGIALDDILTGMPDFIGQCQVCTVSASGKAKLIKCLKCPLCGYSVKGKE